MMQSAETLGGCGRPPGIEAVLLVAMYSMQTERVCPQGVHLIQRCL